MENLLMELIYDWWVRPLPRVVKRDLDVVGQLKGPVKKVVILTGFRRVGKTYLLFDVANTLGQKNCVYLNMEDERLPGSVQVLTELVRVAQELTGRKDLTFIIDEIQNATGWSLWARRINDETNHRLIVTGSSSQLSIREIPTQLRGRAREIEVGTLNYNEFCHFKDFLGQRPNFEEYVEYGGFPEVVLSEVGRKLLLADEYFETFLDREVSERLGARKRQVAGLLANVVVNSTQFTLASLQRTFAGMEMSVSKMTLARYMEELEKGYYTRNLEWYSGSVRQRVRAARKVYVIDNIFLKRFTAGFSDLGGRLFENLVRSELYRRQVSDLSLGVYWWKGESDREVDFVAAREGKVVLAIQATRIGGEKELNPRELAALWEAGRKLKPERLLLVTQSWEGLIKKDDMRVEVVPLEKAIETELLAI